MAQKQLETIFAWAPFGLIQIGEWSNWMAEQAQLHPDLYELAKKLVSTVICATAYHFVIKFWKSREPKT